MPRPRVSTLLLVLAVWRLAAQPLYGEGGADGVLRVGPGVTPPHPLYKPEPEFSSAARANHIQGTVVFQLVVNEKGQPTDITVVSPLGYGLDEQARAAIETWKFAPGMKDGKAVKILATIEVSFHLGGIPFDERMEQQRTSFNLAVSALARNGARPKAVESSVKTIQDLSRHGFPAAMYRVGLWEIGGEHTAKDPAGGLALIGKAAGKRYGPALYEIATRQMKGRDLPQDEAKGWSAMREASMLGSSQAQFYLGNRYENGVGVIREPGRAREYFRLCAARGVAACQFRLGNLLYSEPGRRERDYVQAIAWLQLASEGGIARAKEILAQEERTLTPEQVKWVGSMKGQLVRQ